MSVPLDLVAWLVQERYLVSLFYAIRQNWLLTLEVCHSGDHQYPNCNPDGTGRYQLHGAVILWDCR